MNPNICVYGLSPDKFHHNIGCPIRFKPVKHHNDIFQILQRTQNPCFPAESLQAKHIDRFVFFHCKYII